MLFLFDVDGTLVDSQHLIVAAQHEAFAAHGLDPPSRAHALSVVGLSLPEAFTALVGPRGPVEGLATTYREAFQRLRRDPSVPEPLFPGALETLAALAGRPARHRHRKVAARARLSPGPPRLGGRLRD